MSYIFTHYWLELIQGLGYTLSSSIIALIASMIIGTMFAIFEVLPNRVIQIIGRVYIEVFRNIPLLVIAMFFYVIVPMYVAKINGFTAGTIALIIYTSSFIAETVRAGIQAVSGGQMEGAQANGMTYWQSMRFIVLPQAFKIVIPPLGNQFINLVKNSSVLSFVAGFDLMYQGNSIASLSLDTINSYMVIGVFYLIITLPLSYYMRNFEKRLA
ncbi:amino acid ABC transporter permease [Lactiplantibacillus paraplantarum]|uniref:amino acid ABC transporter permease n=1 Tax=Lactiplantibacillus paraplantarum TaxID=60520 RepID=UPI0005147E30|nr:amino acid ABC transporter permease [Lactiplantibacillus paraplantarum]ALO03406.1 glutamine ABC transporter permease [Lactiplantibacillus paraplantarum]KGE76615.1 glutamine ABC transporter permease [Lactiplantibacillus paraplantarum]OAX76465.1 glutamine ABC transporter permease [Lactiplantibacillus plantarum]RDG12459.1 amino acid ABC transporter permease [Lactiplantibacillus paraplantarum]